MEKQIKPQTIMKDDETWKAIKNWWEIIQKRPERRGDRALLRRCREPGDVLLYASFYELEDALPHWPRDQMLALAAIAGLLSHVNTHTPVDTKGKTFSFPGQLGTSKGESGGARMSENRFRQLIKSRNWQEFYFRMRRAVLLLKRNTNIISLAKTTLAFGLVQKGYVPEEPGKGFQFSMANAYFKAAMQR